MIYRKKLLTKKQDVLSLSYGAFNKGIDTKHDDNILPHRLGKMMYNYDAKEGSLRCGYGFSELMLPKYEDSGELRKISPLTDEGGGLDKLWFFRYYNEVDNKQTNYVFCHGLDNAFYYFRIFSVSGGRVPLGNKTMENPTGIVYMIDGQDCVIFTSPTDDMLVATNGSITLFQDAPKICSMCVHYERVFAILDGTGKKLAFSANLDPTNWDDNLDDAGYIEMADERGRLIKVISFNDYVYVFRENGVTRVSGYGDQLQFSVTNMFVTNSLIYGETVTVCENKVLFLARDGVHVFSGASAYKLDLGIEKLFEGVYNDNAKGLFWNGRYYLACRLNFNDGEVIGQENENYKNNALLEIDTKTYELKIMRGVDISDMIAVEDGQVSKLIATFRGEHIDKLGMLDESGELFGTPLKKVWVSPFSNLGYPGKLKRIKELTIETAEDCSVKIRTEREEKMYDVKLSEHPQRIRTDVTGEKAEISFISNGSGNLKISCPTVTIGIVK